MITALEIVMQHIRDIVDVPVSSRVPPSRPDAFVRVDQGSPYMVNPITERNIVFVQVYGVDLEKVLGHIGAIRTLLWDLDAIDARVQEWDESEGPHDYPDPDLPGVIRWQLSGELSFTHT